MQYGKVSSVANDELPLQDGETLSQSKSEFSDYHSTNSLFEKRQNQGVVHHLLQPPSVQ
jgi:hypothetical protein